MRLEGGWLSLPGDCTDGVGSGLRCASCSLCNLNKAWQIFPFCFK